MKDSKIEWTDHTFNPWIGCTKVSPGCANCYAETLMDTRYGRVKWGKGQPRQRTSAANWKLPLQWNREAGQAFENWETAVQHGAGFDMPKRPRVFCASLADWLDDEVPIEWLADLIKLIHDTPNLDWLLLTKRPENWQTRVDQAYNALIRREYQIPVLDNVADWLHPHHVKALDNVWIGTTVEDQARADQRIPELLKIPARVRFLSCEPLLGKVNLAKPGTCAAWMGMLDWVICGGESGPNARPMHPEWARSLRDQCEAAEVPFLFKQWGKWKPLCGLYDDDRDDKENGSSDQTQSVELSGEIVTDRQPDQSAWIMDPVGKKESGRLLDGVEHNGFPKGGVA